MSIEDAIIAQSRPYVVSRRLNRRLSLETAKGCLPEISQVPVELEPAYDPFVGLNEGAPYCPWIIGKSANNAELIRLNIWLSPNQKTDWNRSELMNKQLSSVRHRVAMEITGNSQMITLHFLCHWTDAPIIKAAFQGQFEECRLTLAESTLIPSGIRSLAFYDYFPHPPYSYLFTGPEELQRSPYTTLISTLADFPPGVYGLYQVVFEPVSEEHYWHQNIRQLLDTEFRIKSQSGIADLQKFAAQIPSSSLLHMSNNLEMKSHNDKPLFAVSFKIAVFTKTDNPGQHLMPLASLSRLFQHGGRPLQFLSEREYTKHGFSLSVLKYMFEFGTTYRCGFLLNSEEMTSLIHIPSPAVIELFKSTVPMLETLPANESDTEGILLGYSNDPIQRKAVYLLNKLKSRHVHLIGRPGSGKSHQMLIMILDEIIRGQGVFVIDPHRTLIQNILEYLPQEDAHRVMYINPGDYDNAVLWNPLSCGNKQYDKIANNIVSSFKSFVSGWGHRLEHLFRHAIIGAMHLPGGNMQDVSILLEAKSPKSLELQESIINSLSNDYLKRFWMEDFRRYSSADIAPVKHKLSALMSFLPVQQMFSQRSSAFDLNTIIETNKIVLFDLSDLASEVKKVMGSFILSMLHLAALGRKTRKKYSPFHIYCDEAHNFMTDAMEEMIAETRKYNVSLTLAHQYLKQFAPDKVHALSTVGSQIIFQVNESDAIYLKKGLLGKVKPIDLMSLETGQAIARIDNQIIRYNTVYPLEKPAKCCRDQIIADSYKKYYVPVNECGQSMISNNRSGKPAANCKGVINTADSGQSDELAENIRSLQKDGLPPYDTF